MLKRLFFASTTLFCLSVIGTCETLQASQLLAHESQGGNMTRDGMEHPHKMMEIPFGQPIPTVNIVIHQDPLRGWNLETKVTNFKFAPEHVSTGAKPGEGHAHLYINGKKITRLYSSWYYLGDLKPGQHEITVELNANSHEVLAHNRKIIKDTKMIEIPVISHPGN